MLHFKILIIFLLAVTYGKYANAEGVLTDNIRIGSKFMGYDLHYRVYIPDGIKSTDRIPTIYVTDGQWYLSEGHFQDILNQEISNGRIEPIIAVFIDSRNPDNLSDIRRNKEFFCSDHYISFLTKELVPTIDKNYPTRPDRKDRVILGMSFGAINSACFGLLAYSSFHGIAMQSPASDQHVDLMTKLYTKEAKRPIQIFMSVGTKNDNTAAGRKFKRSLLKKGYNLTYKEVNEGHDWKNWQPLLDDILETFFANIQKK